MGEKKKLLNFLCILHIEMSSSMITSVPKAVLDHFSWFLTFLPRVKSIYLGSSIQAWPNMYWFLSDEHPSTSKKNEAIVTLGQKAKEQ